MDQHASAAGQEARVHEALDECVKRRKLQDASARAAGLDLTESAECVRVTRENSEVSVATTRAGGSDGESESKEQDPPLLLRRLSNAGSGSISPMSRSGSRDKLQITVISWDSPLGVLRKPSAAGMHLSCPSQDLELLDADPSGFDGDASPDSAHSASACEDAQALEEMIRRQEKAKQAARDLADAIYGNSALNSSGKLVSATKS